MLDWILNGNSFKGNYNFHIDVHPKIIESNSNITLTCYSNRNKGAVIPCAINWFKLKHGVATHLTHVRGNTYMCEPSDVSAMIRAQIRSLDEESTGTAIVDLGPVKIDLITKKNIESIISTGVGNFTVFMSGRTRDRQASLRINEGVIRIKDVITQNCYKFEYTVADPRIQIHPKDNTRIIIRFSDRYEEDLCKFMQSTFGDDMPINEGRRILSESMLMSNDTKLELRFTSRTTKDMLIYSYRAFVSRREVKTALLINKIENLDLNNEDTFNFLIEIESLKNQIVRLVQINRQQSRQKELYHRQIKRLEEEMERIIMTYTKIVEDRCKNQLDLNQSYSVLTAKRDEVITRKQQNLEAENRQLVQRIRQLVNEMEYLKSGRPPGDRQNPTLQASQVQPIYQHHSFTKKSISHQDIQSKVNELSRINSYLADENVKLKHNTNNGHSRIIMKEKSMDNILESLNESLVKDNVEHLNDSLMNLHRENITITKKLEVSMRKNDELEKALSRQALELRNSNVLAASQHSGTKSTRVDIVKIPNSPNNVQSMYVDGSPDVHRLGVEVAELRRANDKLSNENAKLLVARNNEASRCQNLQGEISCLKEEMASINLDKSRAQHTMIVETSEIQRLRTQRDVLATAKQRLEQKTQTLLYQNQELKKKIKSIEFDLQYERGNSKRLLDVNTPELVNLRSQIETLQRRLSDREQTIAIMEQSLRRAKGSQHNSSTFNDDAPRLRRKIEELMDENKLLRKGQDVLNKSRDLSMQMDSYYQQENNIIKQQIAMLTEENERLVKMVEKYSKQVKETTKLRSQIIQLRSENMELKRQLQSRSTVNPELSYLKES